MRNDESGWKISVSPTETLGEGIITVACDTRVATDVIRYVNFSLDDLRRSVLAEQFKKAYEG